MKKRLIRMGLMAAAVTMLLCISALAADSGIYNVQEIDEDIAVNFTESAGNITVNGVDYTDFHANAVKMSVELSGATDGAYYMVFVTKGSGIPTEDNLVYINQVTAAGGKATFETVYPMELDSKETYYIHVTGSSRTYGRDASFQYYTPYMLGDVDMNEKINTNDAVLVLKHCAELEMLIPDSSPYLAADVDKNGKINTNDAVMILKYVAELIDSFD